MKIYIPILIMLFTTHLFAQNKHSELYYQVETICKTVLKSDIVNSDTNNVPKVRISDVDISKIQIHYEYLYNFNIPLLIIDGIPHNEYAILDSIDYNSIVSIQILKPNASTTLDGSRPDKGMILLETNEEYQKKFTKKKKRKIKS
jgi:hypothetical protein